MKDSIENRTASYSVGELKRLGLKLRTLVVFCSLKKDPVVAALIEYLDNCDREKEIAVEKYCNIVSALYECGYARNTATYGQVCGDDLSKYVLNIVGNDENVYTRMLGGNVGKSDNVVNSVKNELEILQQVADLRCELLHNIWLDGIKLPKWNVSRTNIVEYHKERTADIGRYGYGMYAKHKMFCIDGDGNIVPVKYPDEIRLDELIDYKREQGIIMDNTRALLSGRPAANILLTGDAGTGKSSTVKAVVNELYTEGLRILEVRKDQLKLIPFILEELNDNPLKFIIFIDDLSFSGTDDNFGALKAVLEGSVSARSQNVVIYATGNRRHLVKESFSDRDGDDVHRNDTLQETVSLSERFGIHITFQRPDKATYLNIVRHLADVHGIEYEPHLLELAAEQYILLRGSTRSARAARQFIDGIISGQDIKLKS